MKLILKDSMFVYRFVDHELRVETFFKKDEAREKKWGL